MPFRATLARFNRQVTNPVARRFAGRVPPFALVEHRGRRSGTVYRTPVMAFPTVDGFVVALTYGPEADWVRNVLAAGGCTMEYRRQRATLSDPRVAQDLAETTALPPPVRLILRALRVSDALTLRRAG